MAKSYKKNAKNYDVSVVIPTLNPNLSQLRQAVASCFNQRGVSVQVVVVDDTPDNQSLAHAIMTMLKDYGGDAQYLRPTHEGGKPNLAASLNNGHQQAMGAYRMNLDDDDWFEPQSLVKLVRTLEDMPEGMPCFAYGDIYIREGLHRTPEWEADINRGQFRTGNAMMWHESVFLAGSGVQFYQPDDLPQYFVDYDFCVQLECAGYAGVHVPGVVTHHRQRAGGVTDQALAMGLVDSIRARINGRYADLDRLFEDIPVFDDEDTQKVVIELGDAE